MMSAALSAQDTGPFDLGDFPIEIQSSSAGTERTAATFAVFVPDRPYREDTKAYDPVAFGLGGKPLPARWQSPLEVTWEFGDGTSVTLDDRVSVSHLFPDEGEYEVRVTVKDHVGVFAMATHTIEIRNFDPLVTMGAVEIDPDRSIVEFTASVQDAEADEHELVWDFGDGETETGREEDVWRIRHEYPGPGTYEVTLTVRDNDGENATGSWSDGEVVKERTLVVAGVSSGAGEAQSGEPAETASGCALSEEKVTAEVVETGLAGSVSGAVSTSIDATVRSLGGLHLTQIDSGACRFVFTGWDDANLAQLIGIVDLHGVPPEGARYRISNPRMAMVFWEAADAYSLQKRHLTGPTGKGGLGGIVEQILGSAPLTDEQKRTAEGQAQDVGVGTKAREPDEPKPMPDTSPLFDRTTRFGNVGGTLDLAFIPGDRAVGTYCLALENDFEDRVTTIDFQGDLLVDLVAARRDGVVRYEGCEPNDFEIEETWPEDGTRNHVTVERGRVNARFTELVDPATVDEETFELGYTDTDDELVPVAGRILRNDDSVTFVSDDPLLPGVEYTARIKAGDEGVRSRGGAILEDVDGDGWRAWRFWTRVDMVPDTDEGRLLACHVYQSARDVPLIPGKPAIARIWANWEKQPQVHRSHQVQELDAKLVLKGPGDITLAEEVHTFVRRDLQESRGIDIRSARHTAQIPFMPRDGMKDGAWLEILLPNEPGEGLTYRHAARCPVKMWDESPELTVDFVAMRVGEWAEPDGTFDAVQPVLESIAESSLELAWQLFPFAEITRASAGVREWTGHGVTACRCSHEKEFPDGPRSYPASGCTEEDCSKGGLFRLFDPQIGPDPIWYREVSLPGAGDLNPIVRDRLRAESRGDVIVAFLPRRLLNSGGTGYTLRDGTGAVLAIADLESRFFPRYVEGVVHELGHVLGLEHLPAYEKGEAEALKKLRDDGTLWFHGIEGLRMSRDGQTWWNKSSREGNQESDMLAPLMYPSTMPTGAIFIDNHHYREIQRLLEELNQ